MSLRVGADQGNRKGAIIIPGIIGLIVAAVMAEWVYLVVKSHGGQRPWLWAIGAFVFWPLVATIAAFKYNETALKMVAIMGLFIIVMGIGLIAYL